MDIILEVITTVWGYVGVKVLVSHVLINVVVALAAAGKLDELSLSKVSGFLTKKLLPYVAVYVVAKVFGESAGLAWIAPAVWVVIEATLTGDLTDNLSKLGLRMPQVLTKQ